MGVDVIIQEGKEHIAKSSFKSRSFTAPDGSDLFLHIPRNVEQLRAAWEVLKDYTKRIAPNPESVSQDVDPFNKVKSYHSDKDLGYLVFTLVNSAGKPVAVAPAEILSVSDLVDGKTAKGKGIGFIYQGAHTPEISNNDNDFSVLTKLYRAVSSLLPQISTYERDKCLGVVVESRSKGPELSAIRRAGFNDLVPNEHYRPPAVQKAKRRENQFTEDLVLLERDVPKDPKLRRLVAEAYVRAAYCEGQDINPTLRLMGKHFSK